MPLCFSSNPAISIHAAREGGDQPGKAVVGKGSVFQSTPPVKAATVNSGTRCVDLNISIHAAREGGDDTELHINAFPDISIHAAREGGDLKKRYKERFFGISIHAAREGGDKIYTRA